MRKKALLANDKRRISRVVLCILLPNQIVNNNKKLKQQRNELENIKGKVEELIQNSIERLSSSTDRLFPNIEIRINNEHTQNPKLSEILESEVISPIQELRAYVSMDSFDDLSKFDRSSVGISHLVGIQAAKNNEGWFGSDGISSAIVKTNTDNIRRVLHDIAVDISAFHSFEFLREEFNENSDLGNEFAKMKCQFARTKQLKSRYGKIRTDEIEYFSFASSCWKTGDFFDVDLYISLWDEFVAGIFAGKALIDKTNVTSKVFIEEVVQEILKGYKHSGELSKKKLLSKIERFIRKSKIESLPPSKVNILVITRMRPNTKRSRHSMAQLFGVNTWKRNLFKIISLNELPKYISFHPHLAFYKFKVS